MTADRFYVQEDLKNFDRFYNKVQESGNQIIKGVLNYIWYSTVRSQAEQVWRGTAETFIGEYFPYRWLEEEAAWEHINNGLEAIQTTIRKPAVLRRKVKDIATANWTTNENTAFELSMLSKFAIDGKLKDIDFKVTNTSGSNVDAVLAIGNRLLFVEATRITKDLGNRKSRVGVISVEKMEEQVLRKLNDKASSGLQLALANGPTILLVSLPHLGANHLAARWCLDAHLCSYPAIGAVVVSDTYRLTGKKWYINNHSHTPFENVEIDYLESIFGPAIIVG